MSVYKVGSGHIDTILIKCYFYKTHELTVQTLDLHRASFRIGSLAVTDQGNATLTSFISQHAVLQNLLRTGKNEEVFI